MRKIVYVLILSLFFVGCANEIEKEIIVEEIREYDIANDYTCEEVISVNPLIWVNDKDTFYCEEPETSLDVNICSGIEVCLERKKLDSLNSIIINYYDTLYQEQLENGYSEFPEDNVDYKKIKATHKKAINNYLIYCELEKEKIDIEYTYGTAKVFVINDRLLGLLKKLNKDLQSQINDMLMINEED